jgi:COP9 signalosome complex subunit 5
MSSGSRSKIAKTQFELENQIQNDDYIYHYDKDAQKQLLADRPWKKDPNYFKRVRVSAIALLKMATHTRSGGSLEVMGVMTGKISGNEFIVMDSYALPVEGTETRVNALGEGYEYMVQYLNSLHAVGRKENVVGWYHSHPGYGCWLSGIDVGTQAQNQQFQDPYLAIVIDPNRTVSAGKVEIGAFRTYPEGYIPSLSSNQHESIPMAKMEDFGVHADKYYQLDVSYFKSGLDERLLETLWGKYWAYTLSQSPLLINHEYVSEQVEDLTEKTSSIDSRMAHSHLASQVLESFRFRDESGQSGGVKISELQQVVNQSVKIGSTELQGLISREIKNTLFSD